MNYRASADQTINTSLTYSNLTLSGSGAKSISGALTVNDALTISGTATFSNSTYNVTVGGSMTNNSSAQTFGSGSFSFTGTTISGTGAMDFSSSTVSFSGSNITLGSGATGGNLTFSSVTFSNDNAAITIGGNSYAGTVTFNGAVSVSGTNASLTVSGGTTSWTSLNMSGSSSSATFSNTSGYNSFSSNATFGNDLSISAECDVSGTLTVTGDLTISGSTGTGDNTNTFTGLVTIAGQTVSFLGTNTLDGGFSHTNSGAGSSCTIGGTFDASASGTTTTISAATVSLSGTPSFYNLVVSNSSGTFTTSASFSIANTANFSKDLTATGYTITFGASAPASCMLGAGEIIGTVSRTLGAASSGAYDFNGSNTEFLIPSGEFSGNNTITMKLVKSAPDAQAVKRYYDVSNTSNPSYQPSSSARLQLEYDDEDLNGNIEANLKMWYGTYGSAGEGGFSLLSSSQVNTTTNIVWYNFPGSFNFKWRYTMGESTKPLPVELTVFTGRLVNDRVKLRWETATEVNSYGFVIQRKNSAGEYEEIGFVEGQGTKNTPSHYVFYDRDLPMQGMLMYRLKMVDRDGTFEYSDEVEIAAAPGSIGLKQNFPNPFNPRTSITFTAPESGPATLKIYNSAGKEVATIFNGTVEAGVQKSAFFDGSSLPSGTYIYVLQVGSYTESRKMMLVK
ncbi:MAG: T9SS type A sorting domain-containing protein [Chlorobi bacterium]|nr:T9SS type A sorting domain-containing protein [Chlorobiota bacterium]